MNSYEWPHDAQRAVDNLIEALVEVSRRWFAERDRALELERANRALQLTVRLAREELAAVMERAGETQPIQAGGDD